MYYAYHFLWMGIPFQSQSVLFDLSKHHAQCCKSKEKSNSKEYIKMESCQTLLEKTTWSPTLSCKDHYVFSLEMVNIVRRPLTSPPQQSTGIQLNFGRYLPKALDFLLSQKCKWFFNLSWGSSKCNKENIILKSTSKTVWSAILRKKHFSYTSHTVFYSPLNKPFSY